jgi:protein SCO1
MRAAARMATILHRCRLILAVAAVWVAPASTLADGVILDRAASALPFALEDHNGKPFTAASLKGHWSLIFAGYTNCPDVCPFTLANLEQVVAEVRRRFHPERIPAVIFLAVDPDRDRAILRDYVTQFHPDFLGVTGSIDQIDQALKGIDAVAKRDKPDAHGFYQVSHSAAVAVVDPEARLVAKLNPPFDPAQTAQFLADLFRRHDAQGAKEAGQ